MRMSKFKRAFLISLCCVMGLWFSLGCNNNKNIKDNSFDTIISVVETEDYFVYDGSTEYFILQPDEPNDKETIAVSELVNFLYEATSVRFSVVSDSGLATAEGHYISVGNTQAKQDKGFALQNSSADAFEIKTVDNNIYIYGSTQSGYGSVYGVYGFLNIMFGYEFYYEDEIYIEKTDTKKFKVIEMVDAPDIDNVIPGMMYQSGNILSRCRYHMSSYSNVWDAPTTAYHNSFVYIDPEQYGAEYPKAFSTSKTQLCYTGHGDNETYEFMQATVFGIFKEVIDANPEAELLRFSLTLEDNDAWCSCAACHKIIDKYGAKSATEVLFLNDLLERLNVYVDEQGLSMDIRVAMFAYHATLSPPCLQNPSGEYYLADDGIKGHEGLEILFAPLNANTAVSLKATENAAFYTNLQKWRLVTEKFGFWLYTADFADYLMPYDWWSGLKENIEIMNEVEPFMYFNQDGNSDQYNGTCFQTLKGYLNSKLAWDVTLDEEELTDAFFDNYFKVASDSMRAFYDSLRAKLLQEYKEHDYQGSYLVLKSDYFSYGEIVSWQKMLQKAYDDIAPLKESHKELYDKLYARITLEKITVDYLDIELFGNHYSSQVLLQKKNDFRDNCELTNITAYKERVDIENLYKTWGIA